jgi:hypothetical protein
MTNIKPKKSTLKKKRITVELQKASIKNITESIGLLETATKIELRNNNPQRKK